MVRGFDVVSIDVVKKLHTDAGKFFFSDQAMKSFKSIVSDCAWKYKDGYLFYSSEKPPHGPRDYRVSFCEEDGHIRKVGARVPSKLIAESIIKDMLQGKRDQSGAEI